MDIYYNINWIIFNNVIYWNECKKESKCNDANSGIGCEVCDVIHNIYNNN